TGVSHEGTGALSVTGSSFAGPGVGVKLAGALGPSVAVQDNVFQDCLDAMVMEPDSSPDLGGNTAGNCALNGTRVLDTSPITGAATWSADAMPLVLDEATIT